MRTPAAGCGAKPSSREAKPRQNFCHPVTGGKTVWLGRRAALVICHRKDLAPGLVAYAVDHCRHRHCVNPNHSRVGTRHQHGEYVRKTGMLKNRPSKVAASKANGRGKSRITSELAREIRSRTEASNVLAQEYGVARSTIQAIKSGKHWREDVARNASVFNWRPAA